MNRAVIVDAVRTPIGKFGGALVGLSAADLATHVIKALVTRNHLEPTEVDEVILGQVLQAGTGVNVARTAALRAGLPDSTCGLTVNMVCASGMRAIDLAHQGVEIGNGRLYIAGGTESMSNAPFYLKELRWGRRLGSAGLVDSLTEEALQCPTTGMAMGQTAEEIATRTGITREESDAWALRSQQRARAAIEAGKFRDEIVPVPREGADPSTIDEHPRETSLKGLAALKPAFGEGGCVTAGNASGINDGAAATIVANAGFAGARGWKPRATILGAAAAGVDPRVMGLGPVPAVQKLCHQLDIKLDQFELVELNEAFAVQAIAVMRALKLDEDKVNVNGGAVALGHPLGASGARIVVSLLYEMEQRDLHLGLATLCVGGGMGMAMAIRREV